ncbi:hypothetical protein L1I30_09525 [Gillisia sp. M10.2A]|uniref:DUF4440 domain-containing protein n=1 Tax=Gillisia lutea TaxID=2909668 RepID=A0ABS9EGC1_9FLAO|nr:hypothetical protein [Gillisia lutea]MCF4101906.1 hypothetical protein [Gillisia lutea]
MMKYSSVVINLMLGVCLLFLIQSCKDQKGPGIENEEVTSNSDRETEIRSTIEDLYTVYTKSDLKWVDFYNAEYELASDDGKVYKKYADSLRIEWEDIYSRYDVVLRERGEPIIDLSGDQAFHYNSFDELFINKTTKDTIENIGTWIVLWKRQKDKSWKIEFETYHAQ